MPGFLIYRFLLENVLPESFTISVQIIANFMDCYMSSNKYMLFHYEQIGPGDMGGGVWGRGAPQTPQNLPPPQKKIVAIEVLTCIGVLLGRDCTCP